MKIALTLAKKGWGNTNPNPMVGAVLVQKGKVIGKGYHKYAGSDHAEVMAIKNANGTTKGATLYVSLEPCCHYGRTPPCTQVIIKSGVKRIVVAVKDPDSRVSGKGIRELKNTKIKIDVGVLEKEASVLNEGYMHFKRTGKPFVIMKIAQTLDGKIATSTGESKWITGKESRELVQEIRAGVDAILVGSGTIINDNPELIVHGMKKYLRKPSRVILDTMGKVPASAKVFQISAHSPSTYWIVGENVPQKRMNTIQKLGVTPIVMSSSGGHFNVDKLLGKLSRENIQSILVEGGSSIHGSFLDAGVVNKIVCFIAPKLMGGNKSVSSIGGKGIANLKQIRQMNNTHYRTLGQDMIMEGYL